jgi:WD40 repeat protein
MNSVHSKQTQTVVSPHSRSWIAGIVSGNRVVVHRPDSQKADAIFAAEDKVSHLEWNRNGTLILGAIPSRGIVQVWSVVDLDWTARIDTGVTGLSTAHFHPTSSVHVLIYSEFGLRMDIWNLETHAAGHVKNIKENFIPVMDASNRFALVVTRDQCKDTILVPDTSLEDDDISFTLVRSIPISSETDIAGVAWTGDGRGCVAWESPLKTDMYVIDFASAKISTLNNPIVPKYQLGARVVDYSRITNLMCVGGYDEHLRVYSQNYVDGVTQLADFSLEGSSLTISNEQPIVLLESLGGDASVRERNLYQVGGSNSASYPVEYRELVPEESSVEGIARITLPCTHTPVTLSEHPFVGPPRAGVFSMGISPDGRFVFAQTETKSSVVFLFDLANMALTTVLIHRQPVRNCSWKPDGIGSRNELAISTGDSRVLIWSPAQITETLEIHDKGFQAHNTVWALDGQFLVVSDSDKVTTIALTEHILRGGG